MIRDLNRREFLLTTAALAAATRLPAQAPGGGRGGAAKGSVILFQGDSITDCGRNRESADPNAAGALGTGYPLLITAAVLAARAARGFKFYNRGISGNKVPDLQQRWTTDAIDLKPDVLSILIGVNDFWHKLDHGYNGTVQDYEQQYAALLQTTRDALPHVHLIVLEPFVLHTGAVDARSFPCRRSSISGPGRHRPSTGRRTACTRRRRDTRSLPNNGVEQRISNRPRASRAADRRGRRVRLGRSDRFSTAAPPPAPLGSGLE